MKSAIETIDRARQFPFDAFLEKVDASSAARVLCKEKITIEDFLILLSAPAAGLLEEMAARAAMLTRRHFGNVIFIFTPMYISNYCSNRCAYCSFAAQHDIERRQLSYDEVREESERIADTGIRHILVLTGEARGKTPFDYVRGSCEIIAGRFSSVGVEMYPMSGNEYRSLVAAGVDSLTVYQEVYDRERYARYHAGGPKSDYDFRLEAASRACENGMRSVTLGALLGLNDVLREMYALAYHVRHIQETWPDVDLSVSFPRIRPLVRDFAVPDPVSERKLAQIVTAFRILFPRVGITLSTRERPGFRDGILPLGVTRMSAGVSTAVGGHSHGPSTAQFEIADTRSVEQMREDLRAGGFQPVMHDWHRRLVGPCP
ncbi:MAG: 2-iminoacetate synthase ThiH [Chitinivibrionales bacterium]|nr:2-iminoacetate synthase ThiH [Chitinivibrionales bacterium]MBD3396932.1 2-iminoacetate synthase ThiH [Chitinivibrionales bacterium]